MLQELRAHSAITEIALRPLLEEDVVRLSRGTLPGERLLIEDRAPAPPADRRQSPVPHRRGSRAARTSARRPLGRRMVVPRRRRDDPWRDAREPPSSDREAARRAEPRGATPAGGGKCRGVRVLRRRGGCGAGAGPRGRGRARIAPGRARAPTRGGRRGMARRDEGNPLRLSARAPSRALVRTDPRESAARVASADRRAEGGCVRRPRARDRGRARRAFRAGARLSPGGLLPRAGERACVATSGGERGARPPDPRLRPASRAARHAGAPLSGAPAPASVRHAACDDRRVWIGGNGSRLPSRARDLPAGRRCASAVRFAGRFAPLLLAQGRSEDHARARRADASDRGADRGSHSTHGGPHGARTNAFPARGVRRCPSAR